MLVERRLAPRPLGPNFTSSPVDLHRACSLEEVSDGCVCLQGEARGDGQGCCDAVRVLLDDAHPGVALKASVGAQRRPVQHGKPTASAIIEPFGPRTRKPRQHTLRVVLRFTGIEPKFADRSWVLGIAQSAMDGASAQLDHEAPTFGDVLGKMEGAVLGIEGAMICADKPDAPSIDQLRRVLSAAGYTVAARELRECDEGGCTSTVVADCARSLEAPTGWFDTHVCGRHGYKRCAICGSTYVMSCENTTTAAPSVHCDVCGEILVEWGSTKWWKAELVRRAEWPRS